MNPYLELLRPSVCLIAVFALIIGSVVVGTFTFSYTLIIAFIVIFLICSSGNVINDYFDFRIDKKSMPFRPIPSGRANRQNTFKLFLITGIVGLVLAYFISLPFFIISIISFIIATTYSYKLKKITVVKNIAVSWLAASSFLAAGFISNTPVINIALLLLVVIAFLATMGREILKDIKDVKGDMSAKIQTLPISIGENNSRALAFALIYSAFLLLFIPLYYNLFSVFYLIGVIPAIVISIFAIKMPIRKSEKAIKISIYFVLLGFILSSLI